MLNNEIYIDFYKKHPDICIFSAPWWLDAVVGVGNWDVIFVNDKNNNIIATFPYVKSKGRLGTTEIIMPHLTQKLGPYIVYDKNLSYTKRIGYEHKIYENIIAQLPKFDFFSINFDQNYKNWLPFYWAGFNCAPRYSYRLYNIKNINNIYSKISNSKRKYIDSGKQKFTLHYDLPANDFYDYFELVVSERGDKVNFSRKLFDDIYNAVYEQNSGRVLYCIDNETGKIAAVKFVIWDSKTAYALVGIRTKEFNNSCSYEFLTFECIKYASKYVSEYDFEGSMIKGVEEAYRLYGGTQIEYYNISKENRFLLPILKRLLKH